MKKQCLFSCDEVDTVFDVIFCFTIGVDFEPRERERLLMEQRWTAKIVLVPPPVRHTKAKASSSDFLALFSQRISAKDGVNVAAQNNLV